MAHRHSHDYHRHSSDGHRRSHEGHHHRHSHDGRRHSHDARRHSHDAHRHSYDSHRRHSQGPRRRSNDSDETFFLQDPRRHSIDPEDFPRGNRRPSNDSSDFPQPMTMPRRQSQPQDRRPSQPEAPVFSDRRQSLPQERRQSLPPLTDRRTSQPPFVERRESQPFIDRRPSQPVVTNRSDSEPMVESARLSQPVVVYQRPPPPLIIGESAFFNPGSVGEGRSSARCAARTDLTLAIAELIIIAVVITLYYSNEHHPVTRQIVGFVKSYFTESFPFFILIVTAFSVQVFLIFVEILVAILLLGATNDVDMPRPTAKCRARTWLYWNVFMAIIEYCTCNWIMFCVRCCIMPNVAKFIEELEPSVAVPVPVVLV